MKRMTLVLIGLVFCSSLYAEEAEKAETVEKAAAVHEFKDDDEKASYIMGTQFGQYLKQSPIQVNMDLLTLGMKESLAGTAMEMDPAEMRDLFQRLESRQDEKRKASGGKNLEQSQAFLEENKEKEGVKVTDSGLQYKVLAEGDGEKPTTEDMVTVHYRGTLIDGTEFDSSYSRGEPITFPVTGVIKGWTEALQLMSVGSKYQLFIPSDLAYGERGAGADIGPNQALIFEVELLGIKKEDEQ